MMKKNISALPDKYRSAILVALMLCFAFIGNAQVYQAYPQYGAEFKRIQPTILQGLPTDTFTIDAAHRAYPHIAMKGDSIYVWNTTDLLWQYYESGLAQSSLQDELISGGEVTYTGDGLKFFINEAVVRLGGIIYNTDSLTVILDTGGAEPRKDVFYLDSTGAHVLKGIESSDPLKPQVDAGQWELTFADVAAFATTPGLTTFVIWDENTESVGSNTGTTTDFNNVSNVYRGVKSTNVTNINNGDAIWYELPDPVNVNLYNGIGFFLKLKAILAAGVTIRATFYKQGVKVSSEVNLGFNRISLDYQGITLPMTRFAFSNSLIDRVRIRFVGQSANYTGFYLDYIHLQQGLAQSGLATDLNIYEFNGTLTGAREVSQLSYPLNFNAAGSTNPFSYLYHNFELFDSYKEYQSTGSWSSIQNKAGLGDANVFASITAQGSGGSPTRTGFFANGDGISEIDGSIKFTDYGGTTYKIIGDSTNYKPLVRDASGNIRWLDRWPGSGSGSGSGTDSAAHRTIRPIDAYSVGFQKLNGGEDTLVVHSGRVDSVGRRAGIDSLDIYDVEGNYYSVKDSTGGGTPNLQQVTDAGSITTNSIEALNIHDATNKFFLYTAGGTNGRLQLANAADFGNTIVTQAASVGGTFALPNTPNTIDTLATLYDIRIGGGGGDVVGPASATDGVPALFDGTTGKLIKNSTPTGTGNPVMQTSPTVNTKLTLTGATETTSNPVLDMTQTWNAAGTTFTGMKFNVTNTASAAASALMDLQVGGVSQFNLSKAAVVNLPTGGAYYINGDYGMSQSSSRLYLRRAGVAQMMFDGTNIQILGTAAFGWAAGTPASGDPDTRLYRDGTAGIMAQRNGATAQEFRIYNTDVAADDEFLSIGSKNTANVYTIESEKLASGIARPIALMGASVGINNTVPHASAVLDIASTTQGALLPRMTSAQRTAITGVAGLVVFDTDSSSYFQYTGSAWQNLYNSGGGGATPTLTKNATIETPGSAENIGMFRTPVAITVTNTHAVLVGSATPSVTYNIAFGTDRTSATNVYTAGQTVTSTTTGTAASGVNDATIPAGSWVWVTTSAQSGTVTNIQLSITYTED